MKNFSIAKSRRLRSTPYTSRIEKQGVTAYTVYNHMLLPAAFGSIADSYEHLKKDVQVWDVAAERQVEIQGKDSAKLVQLMTCRDLSKSKDGRCYYCPIIDDNAGLINDPIVLRINKDKWWLSIADSDVILFAKGLAIGKNYKVDILVNNAGYALPDAFEKNSVEDEENCIRVLGTSVISLTKLFVRKMIKNNHGKIMIVSSVAAFAPPAAIQVMYGPIKTFMNKFNDALNINYNSKGITSTALCPGYTVTNFHNASGVQNEMDSVPEFLKKSASRVAEEGVEGMLKGKKVVVPTKTWKIVVFLIKIVPRFVFDFLSGVLAPGRYEELKN